MKFGIAVFPTGDAADPATIARLVEERGFESLFFPEHTHIPVSRRTPYPGGGELPPEYSRTLDPFVALTAAATATERLLVATGICLVVERDPIITAKEVASLDHVSGGRFLFGVGAGWNEEEMENHGTDPRRRFGLMRERIEAMKAIWTEDEAEYHGRHVDFDPIWSWPKPVQKPHPPILVGGNGPKVLDRVLAYGDEWMPNRISDEEHFFERVAQLQERARAAGREPIPVTFSSPPAKPDLIERLESAGIHRCVFYVRPAPSDEIERHIDKRAALVEEAKQLTG
jgi:probable F420-dependent oxidoreductase